MQDDEAARQLLSSLQAGQLPAVFHHRQHVLLAWHLVRTRSLPQALSSYEMALRVATVAVGAPNKLHITRTYAWITLVHERAANASPGESFAQFTSRNPELLDKTYLEQRYYDPELLATERARVSFVLPARANVA